MVKLESQTLAISAKLLPTIKIPSSNVKVPKPNGYWNKRENQQIFMNDLAKKLGIKDKSGWQNIDLKILKENGGESLLKRHKTLLKLFQFVFPEDIWKPEDMKNFPKGYWDDKNNQRKFLDAISKELNIKDASGWSKVTFMQLRKKQGEILLKKYRNNIKEMLKEVYPEIEWEENKKYWDDISNQRDFLESIAKKYEIKDWRKLTTQIIRDENGIQLLSRYGGSIFKMLKSVFKEKIWNKEEWIKNREGWKSPQNQKNFLEKVAKKFNIQKPQDWQRIGIRDIITEGGSGLLHQHGNSLLKALKATFPENDWKFESNLPLPKNYWNNKKNQKVEFNRIAKILGIHRPQDWGKVTIQQVIEEGGEAVLSKYGKSLFRTLQTLFPGWFSNIPSFSKGYWTLRENQRKFLDSFAIQNRLRKPDDWGKITVEHFASAGGASLLNHFGHSLFRVLQSVYPEIKWQRCKFRHLSLLPRSYWDKKENQREFMDHIATEYGIVQTTDWQKVTLSLIRNKGGASLLSKYGFSLLSALSSIYSEVDWKPIVGSIGSYPQKQVLNGLFPFFHQ